MGRLLIVLSLRVAGPLRSDVGVVEGTARLDSELALEGGTSEP